MNLQNLSLIHISKASEIVSDGETIMVESGSSCALLVKQLSETKKKYKIERERKDSVMGWNKITIDTLTSAEAVSYTHLCQWGEKDL